MKNIRNHFKMQNNTLTTNIKAMNIKYFILYILFILFISCTEQVRINRQTFVLDSTNSTYTEPNFLIDSINIVYGDSIKMFRHEGEQITESVFFRNDGSIYELRERFSEIPDETFGVDTILTFGKKDTTFVYKSAFDFIPIVFYYSLADNEYKITKEGDLFVTVKQSLSDSTYSEKYYYDENFNIKKFVNTYQDNTCIYIPR